MRILERFETASGTPIGALVRSMRRTTLRTLNSRVVAGGLIDVESRIEFDSADPFSWTHLVHRSSGGYVDRSRPEGAPANSIPSYALTLLVNRVADAGANDPHEYRVEVLDEASGDTTAGRVLREGDQVAVHIGDHLFSTHDVDHGEIATSYWRPDLISRVVESQDELLREVPAEVQQRIVVFTGDLAKKY